jgi:mannose-1-phosphate guanylyltransferase/mannose-1-phosphate guanylyltransferase/mannose-6-phosphate isomerase
MIPVILSGGSGTRLWPLSRTKLPKQFCDIFGESLHSLTIRRLNKFNKPWIITSLNLRDLTLRECKALEVPSQQVLLEPIARNTAPAIALLCFALNKLGLEQSVVGVFPADHLIEKEADFYSALELAEQLALSGKVVTLGIKPSFPATGYGYIQVGNKLIQSTENQSGFSVLKFHEKPNVETAQSFIETNQFFWNAGIFVFKVSEMIKAFQELQPQIWSTICQLKDDTSNLSEVYQKVESISIDYAIMEKLGSEKLACIPCDIGWSDVGSWDAISELISSNEQATVNIRSEKNFIFSQENKKYGIIDAHDLIVVDTKDALLISKRGSTQSVKDVFDTVKKEWPQLASDHPFEYRPWGKYEILKDTNQFKSKVIEVNPKEQLSYQSHKQREEHWIITQGQGEVVLNDEVIPVRAGSYVKIPLGSKHRMRNTGDQKLEFIEVQLGTYFGEDDITRYQDDYQRR